MGRHNEEIKPIEWKLYTGEIVVTKTIEPDNLKLCEIL